MKYYIIKTSGKKYRRASAVNALELATDLAEQTGSRDLAIRRGSVLLIGLSAELQLQSVLDKYGQRMYDLVFNKPSILDWLRAR